MTGSYINTAPNLHEALKMLEMLQFLTNKLIDLKMLNSFPTMFEFFFKCNSTMTRPVF